MNRVPEDLKYAKSHEWVKMFPDGTALMGITDYAQSNLGDIIFVQLPKPGTALKAGDPFGAVESVKAASDLYAPLPCTVIEVNKGLDSNPEKVNQSPYLEGWMLKVDLADPSYIAELLDSVVYSQAIA